MVNINALIYQLVFIQLLLIKLGLSYIPLNSAYYRIASRSKESKNYPSINKSAIKLPIGLQSNTLLYASSSSSSSSSSSIDVRANELRDILKGTCIFFVGMMGSGKSTVGNAFAKKLGYRFLDTDEIAEYMIEMPISEFFAQGKEAEFRELEYQILMQMVQYTRVVISTGGGIVMKKENWGCLHHGIVVFLDVPVEVIYDRMKSDPNQIAKRPLLQTTDPLLKLKSLRDERIEKYNAADVCITVNPDYNAEQVATSVIDSILSYIASNPPLWKTWKQQRDQKNLGNNIPNTNNADDTYNEMIRSAGDASIIGTSTINKPNSNGENQIPTTKM